MLKRTLRITGSGLVLITVACSGGGSTTAPDAGAPIDAATEAEAEAGTEVAYPDGTRVLPDGTAVSADGTVLYAPIGATAPPVDGEGDACDYTLECAPFQVCVGGTCTRMERIDDDPPPPPPVDRDASVADGGTPDGIGPFGEKQWYRIEEVDPEIVNNRLGFERQGDMGVFRQTFTPWGPRLLGETHPANPNYPDRCQVVELDARGLRGHSLPGEYCWLPAVGLDGTFVAWTVDPEEIGDGTAEPVVVWRNPDGSERFRSGIPAALNEQLAAATARPSAFLARPTSTIFFEGDVVLSVRIGTRGDRANFQGLSYEPGQLETAFVRVRSSGVIELISVQGQPAVAGVGGWLLQDDSGLSALLMHDDGTLVSLEQLSLASGELTQVFPSHAESTRYGQIGPDQWVVTTYDQCEHTVVHNDGSRVAFKAPSQTPMPDCSEPRRDPGDLRFNDFAWPWHLAADPIAGDAILFASKLWLPNPSPSPPVSLPGFALWRADGTREAHDGESANAFHVPHSVMELGGHLFVLHDRGRSELPWALSEISPRGESSP